jgi:ribonucleoside-diphosphate reductase alpha chain
MRIKHSNLCTEIMLPDDRRGHADRGRAGVRSGESGGTGDVALGESFVCDLGSMNVLHFDRWRHTDAVAMKVQFLDAVMTDFIERASGKAGMERAVKFATRHRALGLGWFGWHSYLQAKGVPFESIEAKGLNVEVARTIQSQAWAASAASPTGTASPSCSAGTAGGTPR